MQAQIPELLSHFKYGAASIKTENDTIRTIVELKHWDEKNCILWLKFDEEIPHTDQPFMLKCINKEENLYTILYGKFEKDAAPYHFIKRNSPPFRAFFVTGVMIAKNADKGTGISDIQVIEKIILKPAMKMAPTAPSYSKVV